LALPKTAGWGGARKGAGAKKKDGSGPRHRRRERFSKQSIHVTLRVRPHVWNLRSSRCYAALQRAFRGGKDRFGFRLCHYSVQGNHLHLIVEAGSKTELARGMQGLTVRMAKALNRVMQRRGVVFAHRYHAHVLRTPTEVRYGLGYVLGNHAIHARRQGRAVSAWVDPYCSDAATVADAVIVPPQTYLLQQSMAP